MILTVLQETTLPLWAPAGLGVRSEVLAGQTQGHVSQAQTVLLRKAGPWPLGGAVLLHPVSFS